MDLSQMNVELFRFINDFGKEHSYLNSTFIFIAEYMVYILALLTVVFWFTRKQTHRIMVISAVASFMLAEILGKIAGLLHSNNQPFAELPHVHQLIEKTVDNSFPSDHTILFFAFCTTFGLFQKRWSFLWILLVLLVGLSRIRVGVHYPADVAAGALIGVVSAVIAAYTIPRVSFIKKRLSVYEKGVQ